MESWFLAEDRTGSNRTKSLGGARWLLGAALALVVAACGESETNPHDAAVDLDVGPAPALDSAAPSNDVAPARDGSLPDLAGREVDPVDVSSPDVPALRDGPAAPDAPLASEVGGGDAPPVAVDAAQDRGTDTAQDSGSSGTEANAPLDVGGETAPSFCATQSGVDAGGLQRLCYDFSDPASAADFVPEAGTWTVMNGTYNANAPSAQVTCPNGDGSLMTQSVLANLTVQDVRVHAKMTAISAPDKVIVLRSRPGGNRIELNFRASFVFDNIAQGGDLHVSALIDCEQVTYLPVGTILIPHAVGQTIVVDVQLIGRHLAVVVDGKTVFDDTLPLPNDAGTVSFPTGPGQVGFAAFRQAVTRFDDFLVEVLD